MLHWPSYERSDRLVLCPFFHCTHVIRLCLSPAASSISSESSPVSSPATNHSSPVSTPKRGPLGPGPVLVPPAGHSVPNTPPVVTIAPTKTSNGLWRSEGRQVNPHPNTRQADREPDVFLFSLSPCVSFSCSFRGPRSAVVYFRFKNVAFPGRACTQ